MHKTNQEISQNTLSLLLDLALEMLVMSVASIDLVIKVIHLINCIMFPVLQFFNIFQVDILFMLEDVLLPIFESGVSLVFMNTLDRPIDELFA